MKENNGRAARRKLFKKLSIVLSVFICLIGFLYMIEHKYYNDGHYYGGLGDDQQPPPGSSNNKKGKTSLWNKLRQGTNKKRSRLGGSAMAKTVDRISKEFTHILAADFSLIDLDVDPDELRQRSNKNHNNYHGVYGVFCKLNFAAHKEDPSFVPMFRDLVAHSPKCDKTRVRVPLRDVATMAREMDRKENRQPTSDQVPKPLNLTAVVFHESRCGSTLVANMLIGMDPEKHRVYSESPPPVTALRICGDDYEICSMDQAATILRDVLYMMGRTNDPKEQRVFFKIQSIGSRHIQVFRRAFPHTPWLFVYREPVQVMMSHLALGYRKANCLRSLHRPPTVTQQLVRRHQGYQSISQLAPEEFCAAHLATITESALQNLNQEASSSLTLGLPVNYENLPKALYQTILPDHFGVPTTETEIERILKVSSQYSKGRGNKNKEWHEDSARKEEEASAEIRQAAKIFLYKSYQELQAVQAQFLANSNEDQEEAEEEA